MVPKSSSESTGATASPVADRAPSQSRRSSTSSVDAAVPVEDAHEVARRHQDRRVCYIRSALVLALVVAAAVVATFAGLYVKTDENANFEMQYNDSVVKVGEQFQYRLDVKRDSIMTFSYMITSRYGPLGVWPNVTIPDFQEQTDGILRIANGRALSFNPIITQDVNRLEWEAHATESAWILGGEDSILVVPDPNATWPDNRTVSFGIYSRDADMNVIYDPGYDPDSEDYSDVMVPVWQIAPFAGNERAVMFNLHSEINRMQALDNMMTYGVPSLTAILQLVQDKDNIRPSAILFYPVFDAFGSNEVVGSVSLVFSWDTFLNSILPDYIKGMVCVLSASTGQVYSYTISGHNVDFMGEGDLHDPNYDEYKEKVEARLLLEGQDDVGKFITYTLTMYPSEEFEDQYSTNKPAVYAAGAVLIFLFTAGLFLLYDHLVEDRQQKTSRLATQRGNIVDAMFPAAFRDRLYKNQAIAERQRRQSRAENLRGSSRGSAELEQVDTESNIEGVGTSVISGSTTKSIGGTVIKRNSSTLSSAGKKIKLKHIDKFMKGLGGTNQWDPQLSSEQDVLNDEPIAELFHNTSIMFSDIVGFTKWSSERSPNEVFKLLEQIFWEFDDIAARLNIFKLGTIGDCYIAVTGIPEPVQDHAVLLTQFTFEARDKVREVCARLESEGLDTAKLDMRFGIHSGDTTAGILRGTKSRFELFGDTINTASRMESTGLPGKIQVSEETAKLIQRDSKSQWLTKRDTMITAKGKGELQTYWAEPSRSVSFSDGALADGNFSYRRPSLQGFFALRHLSESGESKDKDNAEESGNSTPTSRRSSVELMDVTVEDVGERDVGSELDSSEFDPDFVKLMSRKDLTVESSVDEKV
ncbi:hypothetical protein ACHAW5_006588 [Stephanodiscus triporus]|uniref:Guanylate cyclase domain-containing protein n=1 Tax=Stephanodiscus triporus TaxID=2934178 RepID=A0ABD3R326_9STRA